MITNLKNPAETIQSATISKIAELCHIKPAALQMTIPLFDLGLSSIMLMELNAFIKDQFSIEIPFASIDENITLEGLIAVIINVYEDGSQANEVAFSIDVPESDYNIQKLSNYHQIEMRIAFFKNAKLTISPYFRVHQGISTASVNILQKPFINFSSYNYIGLNGDSRVSQAAKDAIDQYGTSAASSRVVSGEKEIHLQLEDKIAEVYGVDNALVFVSGHATNVSTISALLGRHDLVVCDKLSHDSINQGVVLSRAKRISFAHNDMEALENILQKNREKYKKVLIVTEGLFSMDGDIPNLARLIALKKKYKAMLMIDEAHSFGVLGKTGRGLAEHCGIDSREVDIWMGTLSKSLASCGGYIAGNKNLIEYLRYSAPGFVYSVGMSPPLAAASLEAINVMLDEPWRVEKLMQNGHYFCEYARSLGLDIGGSLGYAVVPIIVGSSVNTLRLSEKLYLQQVDAQTIIYPAVPEATARLRFFISSAHSFEQIKKTLDLVKVLLDDIMASEELILEENEY